MGTTADSWTVGGALAVTGAATLSSTVTATGAATLSSTLAVTGAATLSSSLTVAGAAIISGDYFAVGSAELIADVNGNATTYSFLYCDGTDVVAAGIKLYDTETEAYRRIYLNDGTLTVV